LNVKREVREFSAHGGSLAITRQPFFSSCLDFNEAKAASLHKSAAGGGAREFSGKQRVMPEEVGFPLALAERLPGPPVVHPCQKKIAKDGNIPAARVLCLRGACG
jgi:hypothetical protein